MPNNEKEEMKQTPPFSNKKRKLLALVIFIFVFVISIGLFSGDSKNKQSNINGTQKETVNDTVSGGLTAPLNNTKTEEGFLKIDSAKCKIYKEIIPQDPIVFNLIVGSGSAAGQIGDSFWIGSNPIYGGSGDSDARRFGIGIISCSSWTTRKDSSEYFSNSCIREAGQPFTTNWTIAVAGPSYIKRLGREQSIVLDGYLTSVSYSSQDNGYLEFKCIY
jgi:hypothetical protein